MGSTIQAGLGSSGWGTFPRAREGVPGMFPCIGGFSCCLLPLCPGPTQDQRTWGWAGRAGSGDQVWRNGASLWECGEGVWLSSSGRGPCSLLCTNPCCSQEPLEQRVDPKEDLAVSTPELGALLVGSGGQLGPCRAGVRGGAWTAGGKQTHQGRFNAVLTGDAHQCCGDLLYLR